MTDGIVHNELGRADEREVAVEDFKRKLVDASGELIPLAKPGPHGEKIIHYLKIFYSSSEEVEVDAWYDTSSPDFLEEIDGMLLLDIFAQEEDKLLPIGHIDWQKKGKMLKIMQMLDAMCILNTQPNTRRKREGSGHY